jgi:hypothetical protein
MTRGEKIRYMSDQQLAEFLSTVYCSNDEYVFEGCSPRSRHMKIDNENIAINDSINDIYKVLHEEIRKEGK